MPDNGKDIQFQLSLGSDGLNVQLTQDEATVRELLGKISSEFTSLQGTVDAAGKGASKSFASAVDSIKGSAAELTATFAKVRTDIKTLFDGVDSDGLKKAKEDLQGIVDLQKQVGNLKSSVQGRAQSAPKPKETSGAGNSSEAKRAKQQASQDAANDKEKASQTRRFFAYQESEDRLDDAAKKAISNAEKRAQTAQQNRTKQIERESAQNTEEYFAYQEQEERLDDIANRAIQKSIARAAKKAEADAANAERQKARQTAEYFAFQEQEERLEEAANARAAKDAERSQKQAAADAKRQAASQARASRQPTPSELQTAGVIDSSKALSGLLSSPAKSAGLSLVQEQVEKIEAELKRLNALPLDIKTQKAITELATLRERIKALAQPIQEAGKSIEPLHTAGVGLNQEFQKFGGILRNISTVLTSVGIGGGVFALIYGFKQLVADGIKFNAELEQARIAIGATVNATAESVTLEGRQLTGLAAIVGVRGNVNRLVEQLKADSLILNGTFQDVLNVATALVPTVLRLGGGLDQVEKLTRLTALAASIYGIDFKEATSGVLQLLNGTINRRNELVKRIPVKSFDDLTAGLRDAGGRLDYLITNLGKLAPAGPLLLTAFKPALESIKDLIQQISGATFEPLEQRLSGLFANILSKNVSIDDTGALKFTAALQGNVEKAADIVNHLIAQVSVLFRELTQGASGEGFLDTLDRTLPKVVDALFTVANAVKTVTTFLYENGAVAFKVIEYYLGYKIISGIFGSIGSAIQGINTRTTAFANSILTAGQGLYAFATGATQSEAAAAKFTVAIEGAKAALTSLLVTGVVTAVVVALVEIISTFVAAEAEEKKFKAALDDLNRVNFDAAIDQIRRLKDAAREGPGFFKSFFTGGESDLKDDIAKARTLVDASKKALIGAAKDAGLNPADNVSDNQLAGTAGTFIRQANAQRASLLAQTVGKHGPELDAITKQISLYDRLKEAGEGTLSLVKEVGSAYDTFGQKIDEINRKRKQDAATDANNPRLEGPGKNFVAFDAGLGNLSGFAGADQQVRQARAAQEAAAQAVITPSKPKEFDNKALELQAQLRARTQAALKEQLTDELSAKDKAYREGEDLLAVALAKDEETTQSAAAKSKAAAQQLYADKLALLSAYYNNFQKEVKSQALSKDFGITDFASLAKAKPEDLASNLVKFERKAETHANDPLKVKEDEREIAAVKSIIELKKQQNTAEEQLKVSVDKAEKDTANADSARSKAENESTAKAKERLTAIALEALNLKDINAQLDARVEREKAISAAIVQQITAAGEVKKTTNAEQVNDKHNATPEQKQAEIARFNALTDQETQQAIDKQKIAGVKQIISLRDEEIGRQRAILALEEARLNTLKEELGPDNIVVLNATKALNLKKAALDLADAKNQNSGATELTGVGQADDAANLKQKSDTLTQSAASLLAAQLSYTEQVGKSLTALGDALGHVKGSLGAAVGGIGGALTSGVGALSGIQKAGGLGSVFSSASSAAGGGLLGNLNGALAAAGPIAQIAGSVLNLFKGFFDIFNAGYKQLLTEASTQIQKGVSDALAALNNKSATTGQTLSVLAAELAAVPSLIPKPSGILNSLFGFGNSDYKQAVADAQKTIQQSIDQLQQAAKDAIFNLTTNILPILQGSPSERSFLQTIHDLRVELQNYASLPNINLADVNQLFDSQIATQAFQIGQQITSEKQAYVSLLQQQQSLEIDILNITKQQALDAYNYNIQRAQLLGFTVRPLSRTDQVALLDSQYQLQKQASDLQLAQDQQKLASTNLQIQLYQQEFGVVKDINAYDLQTTQQTLVYTKERLDALIDSYNQIKAIGDETLALFAAIPAASGLTGTPNNPGGTNPSTTIAAGGTQNITNVTVNGITINGDSNLTANDVKGAVIDGLTAVNQTNALRGLGYSNG